MDPVREGAEQTPQRAGMEMGGRRMETGRKGLRKIESQKQRDCEGKGKKTRKMRERERTRAPLIARGTTWTPVLK